MKKTLDFNTIINLEYLCHHDEASDASLLHVRDRTIFLSAKKEWPDEIEKDNTRILKAWCSERISEESTGKPDMSPGTVFQESMRFVRGLSLFKGTLTGIVAGLAFFSYNGTTPVNVFSFLLLFVLSQLLFAGLLTGGVAIRYFFPYLKIPGFYTAILKGIFIRIPFS